MSDVIVPPTPFSIPLVDKNGVITPAWSKWITQLYLRAGGASAPPNGDLLVSPMINLGDMIYGGTSGTPTNLVGNTTANRQFLSEAGTGSSGGTPGWSLLGSDDIPANASNTSGSSGSVSGTNVVTNANLTQMATKTIKGNNTGSTANAVDLTVAQVNAILPVFTSTLNGLVPLSGGGTTNFLRADGNFAAPGGGSGKVAYISDQKATNTSGGTATSGSWLTRDLNTLSDPSSIVTTLSSNQFTLPSGVYLMEASAPAFQVNTHIAKLRDITNSADILVGNVGIAGTAALDTTSSRVAGIFTVSGSTVFEIQHQVQTTCAGTGWGIVGADFTIASVFTQIILTKIG